MSTTFPEPTAASPSSSVITPDITDERSSAQRIYHLMTAAILMLGALLCMMDVWRPIDGSVRDSWRETDVAGIARNYYREGMNLFYPRIDWRGDGPGYVESEFPLYPWTVACLYHVFGYHEEFLRVFSYVCMLASSFVFYHLARMLLPRDASLAALMVFALNPMTVRVASAVQPEPLMFLGYLTGTLFFLRWCRDQKRSDYWFALAATVLAILAKIPAIHIGLLYAALCFQTFGWRCLLRRDVWFFAVIAVGVPGAWYLHAHQIWLTYGNSLGISNEAFRRIGSGDFISSLLTTMRGNTSIELYLIWMPPSLTLAGCGFAWCMRDRTRWPIVFWFLTLVVYYIVSGRTTGELWAWCYHIVSVPVAAMLIGAGLHAARRMVADAAHWRLSGLLVIGGGTVVAMISGMILDGPYALPLFITGLSIATLGILLFAMPLQLSPRARNVKVWKLQTMQCFSWLLVGLYCGTLLFEIRQVRWDHNPHRFVNQFHAAQRFRARMEPGLIVASGAEAVDRHGIPTANNTPYMFYWTDRKGFNIGNEEQTIAKLEEFRHRGARYFILERRCLADKPDFLKKLRRRYPILEETDSSLLIELTDPVRQLSAPLIVTPFGSFLREFSPVSAFRDRLGRLEP